ncbi:MAG: serine hydrolase [Bacteroidota bacterium]|nr:serine hydrolase [Bacteroidota bacterium]
MKRLFLSSLLGFVSVILFSQDNPANDYFPSSKKWEKRSPLEAGFDTSKLNLAIRFAVESESRNPRNMELSQKMSFGKEPFGEPIGPFADRGDPTGIIIHKGYIIAEWGEPARVDMTHSVSKSFLSTVIGLAVDKGLIRDINDTVANYVPSVRLYDPGKPATGEQQYIYPFSGAHNKRLTWEVMLRQTSDWEGTLWGKPDWADRPDPDSTKWHNRKRNEPGTVWKYNDVRVNALALAATCVWKRSLPGVLKEYIMDPIGASSSWQWNGYKNSWISINGKPVNAVSGGGHWGGGMFINAYDMARFGLLTLHRGNWNGKQLIPGKWIERSLTPTTANPGYGYMNFFLNTGKKYFPHAPVTAFIHIGNGANIIYVDPEHDLVMVVRWIETKAIDGMVQRVLDALK